MRHNATKTARHRTLGTLLLLTLFTCQVGAIQKPKGWRWYNEPQILDAPPEEKEPATPQNSVTTVMSATEQMDWFHAQFDEALADATLNPLDDEKYLKVMRLKKFIIEKTAQTGMTMKKLLLEHPELSYTKDHPVEAAAREVYDQAKRAKHEASIRQLAQDGWGLYFIYEGSDPLAQRLAPSVQDFANRYQVELVGISKDGHTFDVISDNRIDDTNMVSVRYTPALMLANLHTKALKPLAYGFISQTDLVGRFHNIATDYQEPDF